MMSFVGPIDWPSFMFGFMAFGLLLLLACGIVSSKAVHRLGPYPIPHPGPDPALRKPKMP